MAWTQGDVSGSQTLTADDHLYETHINELRESIPATVVVGRTPNCQYYCDGIADDVQINQAIQAVIAVGGGRVFLMAGTYNLTAPIAINSSKVALVGTGMNTRLFVSNSANIQAAITITGTGTILYSVKNLYINGNNANQSFGDGIYINTPWLNGSFDPNGVIEDVYIESPKNNGVEFAANSDTRVVHLNRVRVRGASGNGFYMPTPSSTDLQFNDCIAEAIALNGFYVGCLNAHFTNCKAFYCGSAGGSTHGFNIIGYNNYFEACEVQDNYQSGFYGDGTAGDATYHNQYCTFVNCIADSNGQNGGTTYAVGLQLVNCVGWQIIGGVFMTRPYPSFTQRIGISLEGTTTGCLVLGVIGTGNSSALTSDTSSGQNKRFSAGTWSDFIQIQTFKSPAPDHSVTIHQHATSGSTGAALNVVSDNPDTSAMLVTGVEKALGTIKIKHVGQADGSDSGNASLSIDMQTAGTAAQGIYVDSTAVGGTLGQLLRLRNQTVDKFVVGPDGTVTMQGKMVVTNGNPPASSSAAGVVGQIAWDSSFIYICIATNTWKRVAIATW
jgi:hypothetical protein